ncbi:MAG: OmpH family outer membrane protein [Selenomonadales bacterium]|jgi:outer membrane protein|nr:OmpH family outer membrane protein [Selenomonadales bacterium]MBQ2246638.1 OmpH family outer membrane protein [Selenomonadales bacterium]MBQ5587765.1 OmpH family outer membrane protein [Selenomonadales bacterium]MBQ5636326.1 OmpH family outer membrane protein [Selenomonadales bacterium]MBQ5745751.1 OmpH family outer membrane protein [Selenomonadales bacterium]
MKMKKGLLVGMALMGTLLVAGCGSEPQFGVLDGQRVMAESPKIQAIQQELQTKGEAMQEQLRKDQRSMSAAQFAKKQKETMQEFMVIRKGLETQLEATMETATSEVAAEKKLNLILYKQGVAQGGIDVTDDVIKKLQ